MKISKQLQAKEDLNMDIVTMENVTKVYGESETRVWGYIM